MTAVDACCMVAELSLRAKSWPPAGAASQDGGDQHTSPPATDVNVARMSAVPVDVCLILRGHRESLDQHGHRAAHGPFGRHTHGCNPMAMAIRPASWGTGGPIDELPTRMRISAQRATEAGSDGGAYGRSAE